MFSKSQRSTKEVTLEHLRSLMVKTIEPRRNSPRWPATQSRVEDGFVYPFWQETGEGTHMGSAFLRFHDRTRHP